MTRDFNLNGVSVKLTLEAGHLLLNAGGLPNLQKAKLFFSELQHHLARVCLEERIALSIPTSLAEPRKADILFMPQDIRCMELGWPEESICPWIISNRGASVYPEHEFVAIDEVIQWVPQFNYSLDSFIDKLRASGELVPSPQPADEILLLAVNCYTHATRSTQWVWSFLLAVMTLEMLTIEIKSNLQTNAAIKTLVSHACTTYANDPSIDLVRIRSCINQAKTESKTSTVKSLVRNNCAPGIAKLPLPDLFVDAKDCDRKIGAMYDLRSKYMHEGRVIFQSKSNFSFNELHNIAMSSLHHILYLKLVGEFISKQ